MVAWIGLSACNKLKLKRKRKQLEWDIDTNAPSRRKKPLLSRTDHCHTTPHVTSATQI